jgi:dipeptidyl aminopeptidase/acylaminoacyl peptidase
MVSRHSTFLRAAFELQIDDGNLYWTEIRPAEKGRSVVVRRTKDGKIEDVTPPNQSARTLAHDPGMAAYIVSKGMVYFSNYSDQRLYRQVVGEESSRPITPALGDVRYTDADMDRLICLREDHRSAANQPLCDLVGIDLEGKAEPVSLVSGNDYYISPRVSPDGSKLAWVTWNNPSLVSFGCELWQGNVSADGTVQDAKKIAGGKDESVTQPKWSTDGVLHFISDRSNWWNLYRYEDGEIEPMCPMNAEFTEPPVVLKASTYAFTHSGKIFCTYFQDTLWHLAILDESSQNIADIKSDYNGGGYLVTDERYGYFVGATRTKADSIVRYDFGTDEFDVLYSPVGLDVDSGYLSPGEVVDFPTSDGWTAHAIYYSPKNKDFAGFPGELPPLLVFAHGGPTGERSVSFDLDKQYWTSRGFGYLDVNYGGSCGYGREYRKRLDGNWGVVDVDDCVNGAIYMSRTTGRVDPDHLIVRGASAGGYTVMASVAFRERVYSAAASHFGLSDLERMKLETHEYGTDRFVGPYPERRDLYIERSPRYSASKISTPIIIFQGLEDKIVPRDQAELIVDALRKNKVPFAYIGFEGERHGFRKAENRKKALDSELYFYSKVLGFELPEKVEEIRIENSEGVPLFQSN